MAYPQYEQVLHVAQNAGAHVAGTDFTDSVLMHLVFRAGEEAAFTAAMTELMAGREDVEVGSARFAEF